MEIVFQLDHQIIAREDQNILAAKSKNYVRARFVLLSDDWVAPITAIFGSYTVVLDEKNSCVVPWEVLSHPGTFKVSAFCGDLHTSTWVNVSVLDTGYIAGETPEAPTPNVYSQLIQMVQSGVDEVRRVGADANQDREAAANAAEIAASKADEAANSATTALDSEGRAVDAALSVVETAEQAKIAAEAALIHASEAKASLDSAALQAQNAALSAQAAKDAVASIPSIDDSKASKTNPWSGAKTKAELGLLEEGLDELIQAVEYLLGTNEPETFEEIRSAVANGFAEKYFSIGDQLKTNWTDETTAYEDPFDIVQLNRTYELESGATINGMMIQQHYANVKACEFDAQEALYDADEELPAGTYHFTVACNTWLAGENGKILQFTLTRPIPAGGQLVYADVEGYNKPLAGQAVHTFSSATDFTPIESVILTEGSDGVDLGATDGKGALNHFQRAFRGSGRWKTSMLRQYLNSDKPAGQWWRKQNKWDRASTFHSSCPGYLAGFDPDFLAAIQPVKVRTVRDETTEDGGIDLTFDRFFPISLEQMNIIPETAGAEGETLDYWKEMAKHNTAGNLVSGKFEQYGTYPILSTCGLDAKTSARLCWLRSTKQLVPSYTWVVHASGYIYTGTAIGGFSCAPACVIG